MEINVLSIDWDYFFPDPVELGYDWGASENPDMRIIFYEAIWEMRAFSLNCNGVPAIKCYLPDNKIDTFWDRMIVDIPYGIFISDSHEDMYHLLKYINVTTYSNYVRVINYDAHHDLGPAGNITKLNCGNWAKHGLIDKYINEYYVVHPLWKHEKPDPIDYTGILKKNVRIRKQRPSIKRQRLLYHYVFICRSSAWTPSWSDVSWFRFINWWRLKHPLIWAKAQTAPYAMSARPFNMENAKNYRDKICINT